ncbi:Uncharacterised protein [Moraxella caprae]|uniref:Uncharacterized protein n=1 Tax=Moraxella caprae TaxID=90240 RepID=A0A378R2Z9_9GAMM|nr:hypothetical protein [Moraxella caprae]STZ08240.1 Uncharacterised protein [Moraxella caprae]
MIALDLPPQVETQIVQIAKQQNMSASDYLVSMAEKLVAEQQPPILFSNPRRDW